MMTAFAARRSPLPAAAVAALLGFVVSPAHAQSDNAISMSGVLTDEGVECPAMRGDDGALYTLLPSAAIARFGPGDRLTVRGTAAETSFCQQGLTIEVTTAEADGPPGENSPQGDLQPQQPQ